MRTFRLMFMRESTTNVRSSWEEKALWKKHAPNGDVSKWARFLMNREAEQNERKK